MNDHIQELFQIFTRLRSIQSELAQRNDPAYYLQIVDDEKSVIIMGNLEGYITLAADLIDLAILQEDGKHYHLGAGALENCGKELELLYRSSENNEISTSL